MNVMTVETEGVRVDGTSEMYVTVVRDAIMSSSVYL